MSKEWSLAHTEPELAIHFALTLPMEIFEESLGAFLHNLFEIISALSLLGSGAARWKETKLVHKEGRGTNVDGLGVCNNHSTNTHLLIFLRESLHLLEAFLDEASQEDECAISWAFDLVILEENVCTEK